MFAEKAKEKGITPLCAGGEIIAKTIAQAAKSGDATAIEVYKTYGEKLGKGLSVISLTGKSGGQAKGNLRYLYLQTRNRNL